MTQEQLILFKRSLNIYNTEIEAWTALDNLIHTQGQPVVAFFRRNSNTHGDTALGAIFAIGTDNGVGKYKACSSHDDMLAVAQALNTHISEWTAFKTTFDKMFEYDANHEAIKAKLDFYTDSNKNISAGGLGGSGSSSLGALYQLVDVMINSTGDGVEGAVEGSVLAYDATAGKWKAIAQSEILPDMSGYYTKDETDSAINTAKSNLQGQVDTLKALIPATATADNQLADKDFVNSSIATATAEFRGSFTSLDELKATSGNLNDYAFYLHTDSMGNSIVDRYKWTTAGWLYEYTLNNSSFTAEQWAALNSTITATLVQSYNSHLNNSIIHITSAERTAWNAKWDYNEATIKGVKVNAAVLADKATIANSINTFIDSSISTPSAGWYRIAYYPTRDMVRGLTEFQIYTYGGANVPIVNTIRINGNWGLALMNHCIIDGLRTYIGNIRTTYDDTNIYLEFYCTEAISAYLRVLRNNASVGNVNETWKWYTNALPEGGGTEVSLYDGYIDYVKTAETLRTTRYIFGLPFDGSADCNGDMNVTGKATVAGDIVCGGEVVAVAGEGTPAGVTDYSALTGKPSINGVTLVSGNNTLASLGIQAAGDYATNSGVTTLLANYADKTFVSNNYVGKSAFNSHTADTDIHITASERSAWNAKWDYNAETIKGVKVNAAVLADKATNADTLDGKHRLKRFYSASEIDFSSIMWWANGAISDIPEMSYSVLITIGGGYDRGWQMWNSRGNTHIYWRPANDNATGWNDYRILMDDKNIGMYNAGSATKLQTPRNIWGQSFDGTSDVGGSLLMGYNKIFFGDNSNDFFIGWGGGNMFSYNNWYGHYFSSKGTERMRITANGNILIGTTTDNGYKLDVNGDINITAEKSYYAGGKGVLGYLGSNLWIGRDSSTISNTQLCGKSVYIRYNGYNSVGLALVESGNVLIGTTTDNGYKLQVNGSERVYGDLIVDGEVSALVA